MRITSSFFLLVAVLNSSVSNSQNVYGISEMLEGRNAHVLFPANSGVAAAGGFDSGSILTGIELYSVLNDEWSDAGELLEARAYAQVAMIQDNDDFHWIICGGWDGASTNYSSTELINAVTFNVEEGPQMSDGRSYHRIAYLSDMSVLITGGFNGSTNVSTCDLITFSPLSIDAVEPMSNGRSSHTATTLQDGRVFITGGYNPDLNYQMNQTELYDPIDGTWEDGPDMYQARDNHAAVLLPDGTVLISGGRYFNGDMNWFEGLQSCEVYDPAEDEWDIADDTNYPHSYHQMFLLSDNLVLMPGSTDHSGIDVEITYSPTEIYDIQDNLWMDASDLDMGAAGRFQYAGTALSSSSVIVCGGVDAAASTGEIYSLTSSIPNTSGQIISAFPNPCNSWMLVSVSQQNEDYIKLFDMQGRCIHCEFVAAGQKTVRIDTSQFEPGIYNLQFGNAKMNSGTKLVVIH